MIEFEIFLALFDSPHSARTKFISNMDTSDYRIWHLVVHKNQLTIFIGLAAAVGTFGLIESAFLSSFVFFILAIANYAMAAFFAFKYFTYDRNVRSSYSSRRSGSKRSTKR